MTSSAAWGLAIFGRVIIPLEFAQCIEQLLVFNGGCAILQKRDGLQHGQAVFGGDLLDVDLELELFGVGYAASFFSAMVAGISGAWRARIAILAWPPTIIRSG